ncbi:MAG: DUF1559 domain-containing protein [Candidatus Omnitrophica bacterium]|nr:DUF1559 domain-containing protein [Candidatus Omnitrophota bacterium]
MKKGFSLLEILILTFIGISILFLILGVFSNSREFARTMGCVNNMKTIAHAIEMFQSDFKDTPVELKALTPTYIQNLSVFHCPSDRQPGDSYSKFYIGRYFAEEDSNKVFLICPRHFKGRRIVAGYLSYAVEVGKNKEIIWNDTIIAKPGEKFNSGKLKFEDSTEVSINGEVGVVGSFTDPQGKIYSIISIPEGTNSSVNVNHQGDSRFEVITPAVIAGVEGTKFNVVNEWINGDTGNIARTTINVTEGNVIVRERNQGRSETVGKGEEISVDTKTYENPVKNVVPRKPPKVQPHIIKKKK